MLFERNIQPVDLEPKWTEPPNLDFSYSYTIGIDLGKMRDATVITTIMSKTLKGKTHHFACDIQKLTLSMNFVKQAEAINAYMQKPHFRTWPYKLLIDSSGLGLPVVDLIASEYPELKFQKVVITAGDKRHSRNGLVRNVIKWISKPNFFISSDVEGSEQLKEEIISLKMDYRNDGSSFFETTTDHDDHLMSLALGLNHLESKTRVRGGSTDFFFSNVK